MIYLKSFESRVLRCTAKNLISKEGSRYISGTVSRFKKDDRNHYEVLEIKQKSSAKEIREAFLKLSKESHPDKNQDDPNTHDKFVRINEAYSVLSQPSSRAEYDLSLPSFKAGFRPMDHTAAYQGGFYKVNVRRGPTFRRDITEDFVIQESLRRAKEFAKDHENYYGVKGLKKKSNSQVFGFMLFVSIFAGFLQYYFVKFANTAINENFDQRAAEYNLILKELKMRAEVHGNKYIIDDMFTDGNTEKNTTEPALDKKTVVSE